MKHLYYHQFLCPYHHCLPFHILFYFQYIFPFQLVGTFDRLDRTYRRARRDPLHKSFSSLYTCSQQLLQMFGLHSLIWIDPLSIQAVRQSESFFYKKRIPPFGLIVDISFGLLKLHRTLLVSPRQNFQNLVVSIVYKVCLQVHPLFFGSLPILELVFRRLDLRVFDAIYLESLCVFLLSVNHQIGWFLEIS